MAKLDPTTRECIRLLYKHDVDEVVKLSEADKYDYLNYLYTNGYSTANGKLLTKGVKEYNRIMKSGDGPESLKSMFNPNM